MVIVTSSAAGASWSHLSSGYVVPTESRNSYCVPPIVSQQLAENEHMRVLSKYLEKWRNEEIDEHGTEKT